MTTIISPSGQKNNEFSQWDIAKKYRVGDLVIHNQQIYETTSEVPAGTPFDIADPNSPWFLAVIAEEAQNAVNAQNAQSADEALALDAPDTTAIKIGGGTLGQVLKSLGDGTTEWGDAAGGGGTPGGANTQVQFNDNGVFGAAPSFTFVADTDTVTVQHLSVTGEINTALIPSANVTYDLGSASLRWNDLYLSNSTIYMGDQTISANATHVSMGNVSADTMTATTMTANLEGTITLPGSVYAASSPITIKGEYGVILHPSHNTGGTGPELAVYYNDGIEITPNTNDYLAGGTTAAPLFLTGAYSTTAGVVPGPVTLASGRNTTDNTYGNITIGNPNGGNTAVSGGLVEVSAGEAAYQFRDSGVLALPNGFEIGSASGSALLTTPNSLTLATDNGNLEFTVGGLQQWRFATNGALVAANTTAEFLGTSDQEITLRAGGLNIGTIDNLVAGGAVNDFAFVAGNAAAGDSPAAGGAITITTGRGGVGLNGNDGGAGGAFIVSTGLGGTCEAGSSPGASGEIILTTTDSLPAVGVPGVTSGPITITTGNGGDTDTTEAGGSGEITIRTGNGGTGGEFAWSRESGDLTLATGNGGDIIPGGSSRDAESAGSIILQGGTGGNSPTRGGGRGGAIELIGGTGGQGGTRGAGGGPITLAAGNGTEGFTEEPGSGGRIEIIAGDAGSSGTIYGGTADGVEIYTGNGGDGVDASSVDHNGGSPRGDGGEFRLVTGNGGSVQLGEPGYGGNIEIEGGKGGDNNADNGGNAGNMTITLGNGGDSSASNGGIGGSFTLTAGNGGTGGSNNGDSGSITLTTQAGSIVLDPTGQITLPLVNGEQIVIKGTRTSVIGTISNPVPNTPTVVYAVAARAFKISFTITHTTNTFDLETEFFDVVVARGTTTLFSVSNRLNTFGSGVAGVNDTVVTVDINGTSNEIEVSLTTKIGTAASVAYSVTEFKN